MTDSRVQSIYDVNCVDLMGNAMPLRQFLGQPMLIVNTASLCGYSTQFAGLESLWIKNKDKGLIVLGVPSNDFGHQEPGNSPQIMSLCTTKFGVTFRMTEKSPVRGPKAHSLFQWLAQEGGFLSKPRWNFYKYIIGRDGHLKNWFSPLTSPDKQRFEGAVTKAVSATL